MTRFAAAFGHPDQWSKAMSDSYRNRYENVRIKREDGTLEVALHSGGGPPVFNGYVHEALVGAFRDIGDDPENHVVILNAQQAKG
jgi:enoyl-CoA hydratase/carnithine racemase